MSKNNLASVKKILITGGSGFIGTNYIEYLLKERGVDFINLDINPPRNPNHKTFWRKCDLLDAPNLKKIIKGFSPTHVVHLAAKTGTAEGKLSVFAPNIEGVENLLDSLGEVPLVKRAIFTSSLLVCKMGYMPKNDIDYKPSTPYGLSKVKMEQIIRSQKDLSYCWTITRPIAVWGPWLDEPYKNMFKAIKRGWYFHIGSGHHRRSMGYVENMAHQIHQILLASPEKVDKKTFYLGDSPPTDLFDFANEIQKELSARKIYRVPLWIMKLFARTGDIFQKIGWKKVPLTSFRLNNIITEYVFDFSPITEISGDSPYDFRAGIRRTIQWMRQEGAL